MHPVANHLVQLQELMLIRDEQKVVSSDPRLAELDGSIKEMRGKLPSDISEQFEALQKRDHMFIVPVAASVCAGCGMALPISLVQTVKRAEAIHSCPNCARLLYAPLAAAMRTSKTARRTAPRKVGIARFSSEKLMVPELTATDVDGTIRELADLMAAEGFVDDGDKLAEESLRREAVCSTAVDHAIAFPHARAVEGGGLALALGISRKGIAFEGNSQKTKIVFFLAIPTAASAFYLKLLAGLTETFMQAEARKAIMEPTDPTKLWKALVKLTRSTVK